jgi:hypothetical protein
MNFLSAMTVALAFLSVGALANPLSPTVLSNDHIGQIKINSETLTDSAEGPTVIIIKDDNKIIDPPRRPVHLGIVTPNEGPVPTPAPTPGPGDWFPLMVVNASINVPSTFEDSIVRQVSNVEQYEYDQNGVIVGVLNSPADPLAEDATIEEINEDFARQYGYVLKPAITGLTEDEQAHMEMDPQALIQNASGGMVFAELNRIGGQYVLQVQTPTESYNCLASPGNPRAGRGAVLTPRFQNKTPYAAPNIIHIVSKRKHYAGARMPYPVWISGGFAIHGGDGGGGKVTGQRESHGCIRVACARRFNASVRSVGVVNTRITVRAN